MAELDEIKKLSADERIKRLKKLEEEKRREIEEAEKLIMESEGEIEHENKVRQMVPIPQIGAVDINQLFAAEEKEIFASKRFASQKKPEKKAQKPSDKEEKSLEEEVAEVPSSLTEREAVANRQYGHQLASEPAGDLYALAKDAYNQFRETGEVDNGMMYALDVAAREKEGLPVYKSGAEKTQELLGSARSIINYLRGR